MKSHRCSANQYAMPANRIMGCARMSRIPATTALSLASKHGFTIRTVDARPSTLESLHPLNTPPVGEFGSLSCPLTFPLTADESAASRSRGVPSALNSDWNVSESLVFATARCVDRCAALTLAGGDACGTGESTSIAARIAGDGLPGGFTNADGVRSDGAERRATASASSRSVSRSRA